MNTNNITQPPRKRRHSKLAVTSIVLAAVAICSILLFLAIYVNSALSRFANSLPDGQLVELPDSASGSILKNGRLADLPSSASDIRVAGWKGIFTGADYLMFKASVADIDRFISESPSLAGSDTTHFNQYHKSFYQPEWFDPPKRAKGRLYEIPAFESHNWGSVIVNEESGTVYIEIIWS